jgi:Ca2+-binding RTX toxin-like protein
MGMKKGVLATVATLAIAVPVAFAATINGTDNAEVLFGTKTNDVVNAMAGNDLVQGRTGHDVLRGDDGNDVVNGNPGHDRVVGGMGDDYLSGGPGYDTIFGQGDNDVIMGGWGHDRMYGGTGDDRVFGGYGNDLMWLGAGADMAFGGPGHERIMSLAVDNTVDYIFCGRGWDVAWIRSEDKADRSCERIIIVNSPAPVDPGDDEATPTPPALPAGAAKARKTNPNAGAPDPTEGNESQS